MKKCIYTLSFKRRGWQSVNGLSQQFLARFPREAAQFCSNGQSNPILHYWPPRGKVNLEPPQMEEKKNLHLQCLLIHKYMRKIMNLGVQENFCNLFCSIKIKWIMQISANASQKSNASTIINWKAQMCKSPMNLCLKLDSCNMGNICETSWTKTIRLRF